MSQDLFGSALVPIADRDDASHTARAVARYVDEGDALTVVHVVEKAGGAPDKASVEQREEYADHVFDAFESAYDGAASVETDVLYGTDVAETILGRAGELDATAVVYTSRGLSSWVEFLTGNVRDDLLDATDRPVVLLPTQDT
jgi:nucleotide-binding universal stress UspA family protein